MFEQGDQDRVIDRVINDKTRIDRDLSPAILYLDRIGMAAEGRSTFEQRDLMTFRQQPRGAEARDATADHRNA